MKNFIILLFACLFLTSCFEAREERIGEEYINAYFQKVLVDPSSLQIINVQNRYSTTYGMDWKIKYRAKTRTGEWIENTLECHTHSGTKEMRVKGEGTYDIDDLGLGFK